MIKIQTTLGKTDAVKVLIHGRPGTGKTRLCASAPNPIILSAESGLLSLREFDVPYIKIESLADIEEAYSFLTDSAESNDFDTICLDSITEIAEVLLSDRKKKTKDPRQAYGEMNDTMTTLIRSFRDIPNKNIYFSSKQSRIVDDLTGITLYTPMMPGKSLTQGLSYFFDEVFCSKINTVKDENTGIEDDEFYLQCRPDINTDCKDRSGALSKYEKQDLTAIIEKIKTTETKQEQ